MSRTKLFIFLMAVLAMAVLIAAPAVMALWPEPPPIYDNLPMTATISVFKGGTYAVTAEVVPGVTVNGITGDQYKLTFSAISGSISNITRIYLTTPRWLEPNTLPTASKYCSEPFSVLYTSDDWQQNQNKEVLWEMKGRDVMQWTAMSPDGIWFLIADKIEVEDLVPGTLCIGENRYFGCGELAVFNCPRPDCEAPPAGGVAAAVRVCANNYGKTDVQGDEFHYWFFRSSDAQGCIDHEEDFWICPGLCPREFSYENLSLCQKLNAQPAEDQNHIVASGLQGQKCDDEATITTQGNSPFYYHETYSGGYYWEGCYDYGTAGGAPGWTDVGCCKGTLNCP